jgi:hypothetical protein
MNICSGRSKHIAGRELRIPSVRLEAYTVSAQHIIQRDEVCIVLYTQDRASTSTVETQTGLESVVRPHIKL